MIMHMVADVAHRTPLETVLFLEIASLEASESLPFSRFSAKAVITWVTPFRMSGKRKDSAITDAIRHIPQAIIPFPKIRRTSARTASTIPAIMVVLLNL